MLVVTVNNQHVNVANRTVSQDNFVSREVFVVRQSCFVAYSETRSVPEETRLRFRGAVDARVSKEFTTTTTEKVL